MSERIKTINDNVLKLIKVADNIRGQGNSEEFYSERILSKKASNFIDFEEENNVVLRHLYRDRDIPVETVTLEQFNQNTGNNLESAKYRYYPDDYEDTLRRIYLALVVLDEIHIMPGKFQPESEEGRKLLTHELTHVAQNKTKEFVDHRTRKELEEEAEFNERTAESIQDPLVTRTIRGEEVTLPASRWHEVSTEVLDVLVPEWVDYERFKRSPEGYELLKRKYAHWKEHHEEEYRW